MKHLYSSIILLMLAFRPVVVHADNKTSYLPEIDIHNKEVVRQNREIELKMVVDLSHLKLRTQHTIALLPVLVSGDGSREAAFPPGGNRREDTQQSVFAGAAPRKRGASPLP